MATEFQLSQACSHHIIDTHDYSIYKQLRWSMDIGCTPEQKAQMIDIVDRTYKRLQELKSSANDTVEIWEDVVKLFADIT